MTDPDPEVAGRAAPSRPSAPYRVLAAASVAVFLGAVGAGIYQSFQTRGGPPPLSIAPDDLSLDLLDRGRYGAASTEFEAALRLNPERRDRAPLLALHGRSLAGLGRSEEAVSRYREALAEGLDAAELRLLLAMALTELGRFDAAVPEYRAALAFGEDARVRNNLGYVLERSGDRAAAIEEYRHAARLAPDLADAHRNLGRALLVEGLAEESIAPLTTAVELDPNAPALDLLASAFASTGRLGEAIASAERAAAEAERVGDSALAAKIRERIARYAASVAEAEERAP